MSKSNSMFIAFPYGGTLPAGIAGPKECKVGPHEPVSVPKTYGDSLVSDRFAYASEAPKKSAKKNEGGSDKPADLVALEDAVKAAEAAVAAAPDDAARATAEAELLKANEALAKAKG